MSVKLEKLRGKIEADEAKAIALEREVEEAKRGEENEEQPAKRPRLQ